MPVKVRGPRDSARSNSAAENRPNPGRPRNLSRSRTGESSADPPRRPDPAKELGAEGTEISWWCGGKLRGPRDSASFNGSRGTSAEPSRPAEPQPAQSRPKLRRPRPGARIRRRVGAEGAEDRLAPGGPRNLSRSDASESSADRATAPASTGAAEPQPALSRAKFRGPLGTVESSAACRAGRGRRITSGSRNIHALSSPKFRGLPSWARPPHHLGFAKHPRPEQSEVPRLCCVGAASRTASRAAPSAPSSAARLAARPAAPSAARPAARPAAPSTARLAARPAAPPTAPAAPGHTGGGASQEVRLSRMPLKTAVSRYIVDLSRPIFQEAT